MEAFQVHILAADHTFYEGPCESLVIPTVDGEAGILAHHCNIIAAVVPGELRCRTPEGEEYRAAVSEGLVKVEGGDVLVLVDSAERPEEIDVNRARRAADPRPRGDDPEAQHPGIPHGAGQPRPRAQPSAGEGRTITCKRASPFA